MTAAIATDPCMALGQSTRIMIFERIAGQYRRVLAELTLPGTAQLNANGTVILATHESMAVIFEAAYAWNGSSYAFSARQSHRYDVALSERKPYEVPVRFTPGATATTLTGSVAYNFGDEYSFEARGGQRLTIELLSHSGDRPPRITLYYKDETSSLAELSGTNRWSGKLPKNGTYHLFVSGQDDRDETRKTRYRLRLTIRR